MPDIPVATICRCDPASDNRALALAALAWPQSEAPGYAKAVAELMAGGQADRVILVAAHARGLLVAAQIAQILPGRAAMVWPPQFTAGRETDHSGRRAIAARLFAASEEEAARSGVQMLQALSSAGDEVAGAAFSLDGFIRGAELLYLTAEFATLPAQPPSLPFDLAPFGPTDTPRLSHLLEQTYVGTLDCPELDGLRTTADMLEGYGAVGQFLPALWQFAMHAGRDVGCLLVNMHPEVNHAELVYLGLTPQVRGRGWGLALARHAQWLARQQGAERLVLAVDANNAPAVALYRECGFLQFDRRRVWLKRVFPAQPNSNSSNALRGAGGNPQPT